MFGSGTSDKNEEVDFLAPIGSKANLRLREENTLVEISYRVIGGIVIPISRHVDKKIIMIQDVEAL